MTIIIKELMSRTKFIVLSSYRYGMSYYGKSKRNQIKLVKRKGQHSLRNQNKQADQLRFLTLKRSCQRKYYKTYYKPQPQIFGRRLDYYRQQLFKPNDELKDSMRKRLQDSLRILKAGSDYPLRKSPYKLSDLFIAAYKKLKRRGHLLPFIGHRQKGILYKREQVCWQQ